MRVFISWSGDVSQRIGEEFRKWLPNVIQSVKPYFTPQDTEKGSRWLTEISKELDASKVGVFILTRDNLDSKWLHFEAGAISSLSDKISVCPLLFGIEPSDVVGPLTQFQSASFNETEALKLLKTINAALADNKLNDQQLESIFNKWWPDLQSPVSSIMATSARKNGTEVRKDRELIEETLTICRSLVNSIQSNTVYRRSNRPTSIGFVAELIDRMEALLFQRRPDASFTKIQIEALRSLQSMIKFHCDDSDLKDELLIKIENQKDAITESLQILEAISAGKRKKMTLEDDIPF